MSPALAIVLKDYRHLKGELVFCTTEGNYLTRDMVKRPFERITKAAGLPRIRLHDLRHSFASQLTMVGAPQRAVQLYLGHSDPKMTMRYTVKEKILVTEIHTYEVEADSIEDVQEIFQDTTPDPVAIERLSADYCFVDDLEITQFEEATR